MAFSSATYSTTYGVSSAYEYGEDVSGFRGGLCRHLRVGGRRQLGPVHLSSKAGGMGMACTTRPNRPADVLVWLACHLGAWGSRRELAKLAVVTTALDAVLAGLDSSARGHGYFLLSLPWILFALKTRGTTKL